jgi:hypothetical protein
MARDPPTDPDRSGPPPGSAERRQARPDRRARLWFGLLYGGFRPRRRAGRREDDRVRPIIDWHDPALFASAILILVLCMADAVLTLQLLSGGASEANPVMALFVYGDARQFILAKLALTGGGVVGLVALARFRVFRWLRAGAIVHSLVVAYLMLITYELSLAASLN